MIATLAVASTLLAPIPPVKAFDLPSTKSCVGMGATAIALRDPPRTAKWRTVAVKAGGKQRKRVTRPRAGQYIVVRDLPQRRFTLSVSARTDDGRSASVRRTYTPCPQGGRPKITIPDGPPPTTLVTRDLVVGTGAVAGAGKTVQAHYALVTWSTGKVVDASYLRGEPFAFQMGSEMVIPGFEQGFDGMRVGGRREVIVPPALGYGEAGAPPTIGRDETLVFVIDLTAVKG